MTNRTRDDDHNPTGVPCPDCGQLCRSLRGVTKHQELRGPHTTPSKTTALPARKAGTVMTSRRKSYVSLGINGSKRPFSQWEREQKRQEHLRSNRHQQYLIEGKIWREKFAQVLLDQLAAGGPINLTRACAATKITWRIYYKRLADDEALREFIGDLRVAEQDLLKEAMWHEAVIGAEEPIFNNGKKVGVKRTRNTSLLQFLAKASDPETYDAKVRATRLNANAFGDVTARRQEVIAQFTERFAMFGERREKLLVGAVVDSRLVTNGNGNGKENGVVQEPVNQIEYSDQDDSDDFSDLDSDEREDLDF